MTEYLPEETVDPAVQADVGHVAFCLTHDTGLTDEELSGLEDGSTPCVYAFRLDDLPAAGACLMPIGTPAVVKDLKERLTNMDAQYQMVLDDLGDLGVAVGIPRVARPESPREFLRMCVNEVRSLRGDK